jgi:hypothetical protein
MVLFWAMFLAISLNARMLIVVKIISNINGSHLWIIFTSLAVIAGLGLK